MKAISTGLSCEYQQSFVSLKTLRNVTTGQVKHVLRTVRAANKITCDSFSLKEEGKKRENRKILKGNRHTPILVYAVCL